MGESRHREKRLWKQKIRNFFVCALVWQERERDFVSAKSCTSFELIKKYRVRAFYVFFNQLACKMRVCYAIFAMLTINRLFIVGTLRGREREKKACFCVVFNSKQFSQNTKTLTHTERMRCTK